MLNEQHVGNVFRREFVSKPGHTLADHQCAYRVGGILRNLLRCGQSLEACVVPLSLPLFRNHQGFHVKSPAPQTSASPPTCSLPLSVCRSGILSSSFSSAHKSFPPSA